MQRYFGKLVNDNVVLSQDDIFHLTKVMRAKIDEQIEVVIDNEVFLCKIVSFEPFHINKISSLPNDSEFNCNVNLAFGVIKGDKTDFVVQKATELGVTNIFVLNTNRTVVKLTESDNKVNRFKKIAKEASEQCKRSIIPEIKIINFKDFLTIPSDIKLIAYEAKKGSSIDFNNLLSDFKGKTISILIGPEGGFSLEEVDLAMKFGYECISLGKRILRAETACIYALSIISNTLDR